MLPVSHAYSILTRGLIRRDSNRSVCGRCRGKKFDSFTKNRAARRCPQCRGEGSIAVGNTKR